MKLVRTKLFRYVVTAVVIAGSFWFYFQIDTYPYKVARWFQPVESLVIGVTAKNCLPNSSFLSLFVDHAVRYQGAYSAQAAFLTEQQELFTCEIGYKDRLLGVPLTSMHRYRYASTTKLVTIAAIQELIQQGKIKPEDTLVSFLPELKEFADERIGYITIAHLLDHRAGFNRLASNGDPLFMRQQKPWCPFDLSKLQTFRLSFRPGQEQVYSNMGYCLLGEVISRVTGRTFRDYAEQEFSLAKRNIKFAEDYYYDDEVRYDFRHEEWFTDSYLTMFDFEAISSAAGLSGSAAALAQLLGDVHNRKAGSPFLLQSASADCILEKLNGCLIMGVNHYQPEKYGLALHYHEGYLPGSSSVAVIDSFGGVTVVLKSGPNIYQKNPENEWIRWIYKRLSFYYTLQGKLPILDFIAPTTKN